MLFTDGSVMNGQGLGAVMTMVVAALIWQRFAG
jgi:hypothetical protein